MQGLVQAGYGHNQRTVRRVAVGSASLSRRVGLVQMRSNTSEPPSWTRLETNVGAGFFARVLPSHMVSKQAGGTRPATSRRRAGRRLVIAKAKRRANCNHLLCSIPYYKHAEFGDGSRDLGNGSRVSLTCHEGNASVWIDHWVRVLAWSAPHQQSPAWLCVCVSELPSSAKSCCT